MITLLLDSVILIDHFNRIRESTDYIRKVRKNSAVSVITRAEVLTGFDDLSRKRAVRLLNYFPALDITKPIADLAAKLRYDNKWKLPDALQAALAKYHHFKLATRNTKDFKEDKHDFVVIPYRI